MKENTITIDATIAGDIKKVWDYYTQPQHITNWNFASDEWHCPRAENELKAGGRYFARMEAKDGSFGFDFEAVYDDVVEEKKVAYTLGDGRQVVTHFDPADGGTKVTTTFEAENTHDMEMQRAGWQAILNNFKKYVEEN